MDREAKLKLAKKKLSKFQQKKKGGDATPPDVQQGNGTNATGLTSAPDRDGYDDVSLQS
ncbi:hypothetical protein HK104_000394, partial [Borealophlyctis nickersoniae]